MAKEKVVQQTELVEKGQTKAEENSSSQKKRVKISQSDIPRFSIEKSLVVAKALWDEFAGKSAEPHMIAMSLNFTPSSGHWRNLTGSSIAYGLTEGGYNSSEIALTPLGKAIIAPTYEGETEQAIIEAVLKPNIIKAFFERYNKAKLPSQNIAQNVLISMGVPKERAEEIYDLILENGKYSGIIKDIKTGFFIAISPSTRNNVSQVAEEEPELSLEQDEEVEIESFARKISAQPEPKPEVITGAIVKEKNNKVFISHGKNKQVVDQLKEIIKYGKYEPVVSVENETLSKPVPDKVLDDMRSCFAGVINVHSEGELLDPEGKRHIKINDNVLIEIGAAMALFGGNYVLLVQKGVQLPSNLQGLYRCEYEGDKLDFEATMKLLKTFNQFK
ncbi:MAG: nucleotide-binding protein [Clostridia bacterium]|nr:nucleotide-binding protein [Clostridia bacterium]